MIAIDRDFAQPVVLTTGYRCRGMSSMVLAIDRHLLSLSSQC